MVVDTTLSTDDRFIATEQSLLPITIKLVPARDSAEAKSVTVIEPTGTTKVSENGIGSSYDVYLRPCSQTMADDTVLSIKATVGGQVVLDSTLMQNDTVYEITGSDWNYNAAEDACKVTLSVHAEDDDDEEGDHFASLVHTVTDAAGETILLSDNSTLYAKSVLVRIYDNVSVLLDSTRA